ncbi:MAG: metal ABC transporter permease [Simkania negevensis]|nr:metal ABC transporter permease [Simkania negevensis]
MKHTERVLLFQKEVSSLSLLIGSYVVVKRILFISGSIAHSVVGGLGIALYLHRVYQIHWLRPLHGALIAAILSAILIGAIRLYYKQREDTVIASIWAFGMSLGVIFISLTPGYNVEMMTYLFGNILWTSSTDLWMLIGLDFIVLGAALLLHRRFLAICFDETQATLQGQSVSALTFLLLSLVAITIVLLIQVVGAILVIAILSLPPAIAGSYTRSLGKMMIFAVFLGILFTFLGLSLSFSLNWPPGATIAFVATSLYFLNLFRKKK